MPQPKEPFFDHPKENYRILEKVIIQSEKAGFTAWQRDESAKKTADYLLYFVPFPEEIFYHDFAAMFFHNCQEPIQDSDVVRGEEVMEPVFDPSTIEPLVIKR